LLPLAVRVVAALLAGRPAWRIAHVAGLLADERHRLGVLEAGDLAVEASISLSYGTLPTQARQMLRLLAVLEAPDFAAWAGAAVCDLPLDSAIALMERLVDAFLLESAATDQIGQLRYRFHDLVRIFARHHTEGELPALSPREAVERATGAWLTLAEHAAGRVDGLLPDPHLHTLTRSVVDDRLIAAAKAEPVPWLEAERTAIVATVRQAAQAGFIPLAADLAWAVNGYCSLHGHLGDAHTTMAAVVAAARMAGDEEIEATAALGLASALAEQGDPPGAQELFRFTVQTAQRLGLPRLEAHARLSLAVVDRVSFDLPAARAGLQRAIELATASGAEHYRIYALSELGVIHLAQGDLDRAQECFTEALSALRPLGDVRGQTKAMMRLAAIEQRRGRCGQAAQGFQEALELADRHGDVRAGGEARYRLGLLLLDGGSPDLAAELLGQAAAGSEDVGDAHGIALSNEALGRAYALLGDTAAAREAFAIALEHYERVGLQPRENEVRQHLAELNAA
jgi:tetratricopeptide (TPR) repeat protein